MKISIVNSPDAPPWWWAWFLRQGTVKSRNGKRWVVTVVNIAGSYDRGWGEVVD